MNIEHQLVAERVLPWVRRSLVDPLALRFSKLVEPLVEWNSASFSVFADESVSESELMDFDVGGKVSPSPRPEEWLLEAVALRPWSQEPRCWLVEDWMARPNDQFLRAQSLPAIYLGSEVYYLVSNPESNKNWGRISSNRPPLFHAFVLDDISMVMPGTQIQASDLDLWARHVKAIALGVYDAESYLLCSFPSVGATFKG